MLLFGFRLVDGWKAPHGRDELCSIKLALFAVNFEITRINTMHGICQAQRKFNCNRHLICAWMGNNQLVVFGKNLILPADSCHARYVQIFRMQANRTVD